MLRQLVFSALLAGILGGISPAAQRTLAPPVTYAETIEINRYWVFDQYVYVIILRGIDGKIIDWGWSNRDHNEVVDVYKISPTCVSGSCIGGTDFRPKFFNAKRAIWYTTSGDQEVCERAKWPAEKRKGFVKP